MSAPSASTRNIRYVTAHARSFTLTPRYNHQDIELPPEHPDQDVLKWTEKAITVDSDEYLAAKQEMLEVAGTNGLDAVFDRYGLDAIFSLAEGGQTSAANMVGYPTRMYSIITLFQGN